MRLAKPKLWFITLPTVLAYLSAPITASGGVRRGAEHAKNIFHVTGFQTQNVLDGDQNTPRIVTERADHTAQP